MPALFGDSIYCGLPSSSLTLSGPLFNFDRLAISVLASVVSEGSPGSSFWILGAAATPLPAKLSAVTFDRVRGLLAGGCVESTEVTAFLCLMAAGGVVTSAASSPEASLEEGCNRSAVELILIRSAGSTFRLRLPEPEDDGEDIVIVPTIPSKIGLKFLGIGTMLRETSKAEN